MGVKVIPLKKVKELTEKFRQEMSGKTRFCEKSNTQWLYTEDLQDAIGHVAESAAKIVLGWVFNESSDCGSVRRRRGLFPKSGYIGPAARRRKS